MSNAYQYVWESNENNTIAVRYLPEDYCLIPLSSSSGRVIEHVLVNNRSAGHKDRPEGETHYIESETGSRLAAMSIHTGPLKPSVDRSYMATLFQLVESIDNCEPCTILHAKRTQHVAMRLAEKMGCSKTEIHRIALAGHLHDVGKVLVPKEILTKPGPLDQEEWAVMKKHPAYGAALLERSERLSPAADLVLGHHEHWDGSGYPNGRNGEEIPLGARILSVSDAYTTMTDGRIYRRAFSVGEAAAELKRCSGSQFQPELVEAMVSLL
jgi:HD-GYP domain-containing protein (c-di-GMP phosphodiesterase class II)